MCALRVNPMELSPEERQEARQQPQQEPALPKKPRLLGLVWRARVVGGVVCGASVVVDPQPPEEQAADEKAAKQQYDICKGKLVQAKELDVLSDLNAKGSS